ncbi:WD repeat-containing protein 53, variant 2 [Bonamia ostreae]|uniref:WD repeat-containing protein 53, variant 2 n=1 Tax=Bonamia ostreae TaxID=126728 RepID=A0ABV2ANF9_9EUKA
MFKAHYKNLNAINYSNQNTVFCICTVTLNKKKFLIFGGDRKESEIQIFSLSKNDDDLTMQRILKISVNETVRCLTVSTQLNSLFAGTDKSLLIFDLKAMAKSLNENQKNSIRPIKTIDIFQPFEINDFALNENEHLMYIADGSNAIKIYDLNENRIIHSLTGHFNYILQLKYFVHENSSVLVSGSLDGLLKFWDTKSKKNIFGIDSASGVVTDTPSFESEILALDIDNNGEYVAISSTNSTIQLYHTKTRVLVKANYLKNLITSLKFIDSNVLIPIFAIR